MTSETPSDVTDEQIVAQLAQIVNAFRHYTSEYRSTLLKSGAHEVMDKHLKEHWMKETMTPATTELCRWLGVNSVSEMETALEKRSDGLSHEYALVSYSTDVRQMLLELRDARKHWDELLEDISNALNEGVPARSGLNKDVDWLNLEQISNVTLLSSNMELMRVMLERAVNGYSGNYDLEKCDTLATINKFGDIIRSYSRPYLMVVVVRFYGCSFCARLVYSIEKSLTSLQNHGCDVILICHGTAGGGVKWRQLLGVNALNLYVDNQGEMMKAMHLRIEPHFLASTKFADDTLANQPPKLEGHVEEDTCMNTYQQGGIFVWRRDTGSLLLSYHYKHLSDRPAVEELLAWLDDASKACKDIKDALRGKSPTKNESDDSTSNKHKTGRSSLCTIL